MVKPGDRERLRDFCSGVLLRLLPGIARMAQESDCRRTAKKIYVHIIIMPGILTKDMICIRIGSRV